MKLPKPLSNAMVKSALGEVDDALGDTYTLNAMYSLYVDRLYDVAEMTVSEWVLLYEHLTKNYADRMCLVTVAKKPLGGAANDN